MRRRRHPPRPLLGWAVAAGAAACAVGCRSVVDPPLPSGAVRISPPAVYARWWAMTEACAGVRRDVGDVAWYVVPGATSFTSPGGGGDATGYYSRPGNQIVLAGRRQLDGSVVRHEILHALLGSASGHPRRPFLEQCAGLVRCEAACVRDAGPAPAAPAGTLALRSELLVLGAEVAPAGAGTPGTDAWYAVTVTATNPAPYPVEVDLPPLAFAPNFGLAVTTDPPREATAPGEVTALSRTEATYDASVARFAANQTKRYVVDVHVVRGASPTLGVDAGGDVRLAPGAYLFRATFGDAGARAPAVAATLAP